MTIYLPLLICLVGALMYLFCGPYPPSNPPTLKAGFGILGLVMFGCGLLAFLLTSGGHLLNVVK
jgi:hypothetical protein